LGFIGSPRGLNRVREKAQLWAKSGENMPQGLKPTLI
jgi:hypothetical protein